MVIISSGCVRVWRIPVLSLFSFSGVVSFVVDVFLDREDKKGTHTVNGVVVAMYPEKAWHWRSDEGRFFELYCL
jgi:hypothetical protein